MIVTLFWLAPAAMASVQHCLLSVLCSQSPLRSLIISPPIPFTPSLSNFFYPPLCHPPPTSMIYSLSLSVYFDSTYILLF